MIENLELRMYGLVNYQLSGIQQGIQYCHGVTEYSLLYEGFYKQWARYHKTSIILNGGTTNDNPLCLGTLNRYAELLTANGVMNATFREPDLGNQLTSVVFIVDERVFKKNIYPDYIGEKYNSEYNHWL